jgi:hypothetical protein
VDGLACDRIHGQLTPVAARSRGLWRCSRSGTSDSKLLDAATDYARDARPVATAEGWNIARRTGGACYAEEHPRLSPIVLMQLMGPLEVHHSEEVPHWLAEPRPQGLLVGMVHALASPSTPSWNQIAAFLTSMRQLRYSVDFVA